MNRPEKDPAQARAALDDATARGQSAANRLPEKAAWFEAIWLACIGALVLSKLLPMPFNIVAIVIVVFVLGKAIGEYQNRYGVWVSGYRPGRTRTIAVSLAVLIVVIMLSVWSLRESYGLIWPGFVGAAIATGISFVMGRAWMRAYQREISVS